MSGVLWQPGAKSTTANVRIVRSTTAHHRSSGKGNLSRGRSTYLLKVDKKSKTDTPRNIAAVAVACRVGIIRSDSHNCGSSVITVGTEEGDVEGLPLRDILGDDLGRASFIKIDIEGSEAPILSAILEAMDELPHNLTVAAEISASSAEILARFVASGFSVYAIPNIYTIDYYLVRSYLSQCGEEDMVWRLPVSCYDPTYRDYIIERR